MRTPLERFTAMCERMESGCLRWKGAVNSKGYPCFSDRGVTVLAHRWAYQQRVGPIPEGLTVDHACEQPRCVEVAHMELVTAAENTRRRYHRPPAAAHPLGPLFGALLLVLVVGLGGWGGCEDEGLPKGSAKAEALSTGGAVTVIHDEARGVTCWLFSPYWKDGAISCLPDSWLKQAPPVPTGVEL